ncbi:Centrosomal protein of 76 kDa [Halocaridina rubra]|uniref:Centrosomal protein of 76 kDa n=1 Tax=Halocaridina rubra TaxID=373956 RepID=A0AAN8WGT4_HALRR
MSTKAKAKVEDALKAEIEKNQGNLQSAVDQIIREVVSEEVGLSPSLDLELIVSRLLDSATIQSLVQRVSAATSSKKSVHNERSIYKLPAKIQESIIPGRRYLYVWLKGGRAFVDHVGEDLAKFSHESSKSLVIHLSLFNQRFQTKGIRCVCEPEIDEGFVFDLQSLKTGCPSILDSKLMMTLDIPLNIVVVRREGTSTVPSTIVSVYAFEWRLLLSQPSSSMKYTCQLMGIGSELQVPVGLLDIEAAFVPHLEAVLPTPTVNEYLEGSKSRVGERRRLFIAYARQWWQEYTEMHSSHSLRAVKIFAVDEYGKNRFVCEFIRRLEIGRALHSPEEVARWVSLMPSPSVHQLPAGCSRPWYTLSTALVTRLDVENKCTLLCSILLGFGLDAYVCIGTRKTGQPHYWVMTRGPYTAVTFWETITGCRYIHKIGQRPAHDYETVGSVFSNNQFYACCQTSDKVAYCSFVLEDSSAWKKMSVSATSSVTENSPYELPLTRSAYDDDKASSNMEVQLKISIIEHRSDTGLSTHFDDHLGYILTPALWSYENGAVEGNKSHDVRSPEHFSAALMHIVPEGFTFKAFPLHFVHNSPRRAFTSILNSGIGREIVECRGDKVSLAVKVITISYPEYISVTWLMVACTYRPVG